MIKFGYTILYVADVTKAIHFYENTFGFTKKFITPENDYGEINTGETSIAFASIALANSNLKNGFLSSDSSQKPFGIEVGIITDQVEQLVEKALKTELSSLRIPSKKTGDKLLPTSGILMVF